MEEEEEEEATVEDKAGRRKRRSNKDDAMLCLLNVCVVGMGVSVLLSAVCVLYILPHHDHEDERCMRANSPSHFVCMHARFRTHYTKPCQWYIGNACIVFLVLT